MTPLNFVYWLQGYFELAEIQNKPLSPKVSGLISAHIAMCRETPGNFNPRLVSFIGWIESALEFEASAVKIQSKLAELFVHVIDPMTVDQEVAQNQSTAHASGQGNGYTGNPYDNEYLGARC